MTAVEHQPRVTIAIPVYNGERYLEAAIESILAQTYSDFELIICDNASTDSTPGIVAAFAARDPRVRHHRNSTNIGLLANFNLAFRLGRRSPYFKWAAVDDLCAPTLVEECVRVLDAEPGVVLCHSRTSIIGADGSVLYPHPHDGLRTDVADPATRFSELIRAYHWCVAQFGVMRVAAVDGSTPFRRHSHSDRVFLAQLGLRGRIHELPETLFWFRRHEQASSLASRPHRYAWSLRPESRGRPVFPSWQLLYELVRAVDRAQITATEKARCYAHLVRWQLRGLNSLRMARDVVVSAAIVAGVVADEPRGSRGATSPAEADVE